jgi:hypothetical protein
VVGAEVVLSVILEQLVLLVLLAVAPVVKTVELQT